MPAPDARDLALIVDRARAAGALAMTHFAGDRRPREKPGGQGPVTAADLAVDAMLRQDLLAARPDYGWLSEETPDSPDRLAKPLVFVVDPIDGTRAFVDGSRGWAISIAVVAQGRPMAAVVYLPALDRLYAAHRGGGATLNGAALTVDPTASEAGTILGAKPNFEPRHWPGGVTPMRRDFRSSLANRLALVAQARFEAMLSLRAVWDWDIAAGALLVTEAGGQVSDATGAPLRFNTQARQSAGLLAAPPRLHARLLARLGPA